MIKTNNRGTTIVEALVVIVILSLGLIPSLTVIVTVNSLSSIIMNDLIGANLAQEGVEVVRSLRDANWFASRSFDNNLIGDWTVEWNTNWVTNPPQPAGANPALKLDSNGLYNYATGSDTYFRRRIFIIKDPTLPGCNCELRVISEVTWPTKKTTRTLTVESHLFNWK